MRKALAHTGGLRHGDQRDARDDRPATAIAFERPARRPPARDARAIASTCRSRRFAICATARIRISARPGTDRCGAGVESGAGGFGAATILQGKELSYTNLLDLDAAARIVLEFDEPAAVVIKHTNPCGVAIGSSAADAYVRARDADSLAAFGGIVALNRPLDRRGGRSDRARRSSRP